MAKKTSSTKFEQEKMDIFHFVSDMIVKKEGGVLLTNDAFLAYCTWRRRHQVGATELSADGFGKLFPHAYARKVFRIRLESGDLRWARGFEGVELV